MNLKYYLRGLGLGVIVTAIVMGIAMGGRKEKLTNEEIIARAKTLGMTESQVLSKYEEENVQNNKASEDSVKSDEMLNGIQKISTQGSEVLSGVKESSQTQNQAVKEPVEQKTETEEPAARESDEQKAEIQDQAEAEPFLFEIRKGDGSHTVSKRLAEAGIIDSSAEFDQYLIQNGYDKKIVASVFEIPAGADFEIIAGIISGNYISEN